MLFRSLGNLALQRSELDQATTHLNNALTLYTQIGDRLGQANTHQSLGNLALQRSELDQATTHLNNALTLHTQIGNRLGEAETLASLADAAAKTDDPAEAVRYARSSAAMFRNLDRPVPTSVERLLGEPS